LTAADRRRLPAAPVSAARAALHIEGAPQPPPSQNRNESRPA
jgi:hypothetical protein